MVITSFSIIALAFILPLLIIFSLKEKVEIKEKKSKYLNIALILTIVLSIFINIQEFTMGGGSSLLNITATIVYIIIWATFIWLSKENIKSLKFSVLWSLWTLACAVPLLAININGRLDLSFVIPFAIIFITPFYGIEAFFSGSRFIFSSISIIIISFIWLIMSCILVSRKIRQ